MNESINLYLESHSDPLSSQLREMLVMLNRNKTELSQLQTPLQRAFWILIVRGLNGQPVLEALQGLEVEVERMASHQLETHIAELPFKVMIPMLLFMFPAYLLVLIGPMMRELTRVLGLALLLCFALSAQAATPSYQSQLIRSQTPSQLHSVLRSHGDLEVIRLSCRLEIKGALPPLNCFELFNRQSKRMPQAKKQKLLTQLNQLCAKAAKSDRLPQNLELSASLSNDCRERLQLAAKIRNYKDMDPSLQPRDLTH